MKRAMWCTLGLVWMAFLLAGCGDDGEAVSAANSDRGAPIAGMAEGYLDFPVGTPLGGFTSRCRCFGGKGRYDARHGAYHDAFTPSVGVQTQPRVAAMWLENGSQELVLLKVDAIYTFEGVVNAVAQRLSAAVGHDLTGKVVVASSHSHSLPANFDQGITWYLGGDKFNREIFERLVASITTVALEARQHREPVAIGIGQRTDWDPHDRVYGDRRGENDDTRFFSDIPVGPYKDPYLSVLRVDTVAGKPLGLFFAFAMHGTVAGDDNQLWSVEASGHVEAAVAERFDAPVVVGFMQHGGGDASPRGVDDLFARMESIGDIAADSIFDLWRNTPTSSKPISIESITRSLDTQRDVLRVHRDYATLQYAPYNPDPEFHSDDVIYDDQGRLRNPIDEFNTNTGGAFCGDATPSLPVRTIGSSVFPYASCAEVGDLAGIFTLFFNLQNVQVPLPESLRAKVTASRIGPLPILEPGGNIVTDDALLAFFPGEPTSTYTEQFRRRAAAELGMKHTLPIGYAQDHQGYLLIPEDWLQGGYEPNINIWGPLQGEHIMEGLLNASAAVLRSEAADPPDPPGSYPDPIYPDAPLPHLAPDLTPAAGTALTEPPAYMLIPLRGLAPAVAPPPQVRRVNDIVQMMWEGGDPGVDLPLVYLEKRSSAGAWERVHTAAGRDVSSPMHDILLATTPNPLLPADAVQRHYWWLGWQAVSHVINRAGLPLGEYRFHIFGHRYTGGAETWPWPSQPYELSSSSFEVVPAEVTVHLDGASLSASIDAHAKGFRLIDIEGNSRGANPLRGATLTAILSDSSTRDLHPGAPAISGGRAVWTLDNANLAGVSAIRVVDGNGNQGTLSLN